VSTEPRRIKRIIRKLPKQGTYYGETKILRTMDPEPKAKANPVKVRQEHVYALTKPRVVEGYVTLTQLAAERGIQAQLARIWVIHANIKKPADGWRWPVKSKVLGKVRKILGLEP